MKKTTIQFKWVGQDELKGCVGTTYATTVRISDMPYKYCWDGNMLRFGNEREASAITRDDLPRELARYFSTHDFMNYDVKDLWWEIGADNLVAWH